MPLPVPTIIASGFGDATGSCYNVNTDKLYVVDSGAGTISTVGAHSHVKAIVGTGFNAPSDIELSADGLHAYVSENPGTLLRLNLTNLNRAAATVVASGLSGIDQIALDEAHGVAYLADYGASRILRVNLATGAPTTIASIPNSRGVLVTGDGRFVYVSTDASTIVRIDLATNTNTVVASGLGGPRHMVFADAGESTILFVQPNPTGTVLKADLTTTPATVTKIAGPTSAAPYSVAVLSSNQLLVVSQGNVAEVDLTASVFSAAGPVFLGIGYVPADAAHLPGGYADTSMDPTYFFQVKDCPFGGSLPLQINWQHARAMGANFYQVFVAGPAVPPALPGTQVTTPFTDYLWSVPLNAFEAVATSPATGGYFQLRQAGQIWLNNWLGMLLDTTGQPNGLNRISVKLFAAESPASEIGHFTDAGRSATIMIDNTTPIANLQQIYQQPGNVPIGACGLVTSGAPTFTFLITAAAPQQHLAGWSLTAYWGDNKSATVTSDSYSNHITPTRLWAGITGVAVPPPGPTPWNATVAGDPTSTHCAHSFFVYAWDRVINGYSFIHGAASYQKSITLLL